MIALSDQAMYESLWFGEDDQPVLVWFTAPWCGPCKRIDKELLEQVATACKIPFYVCDITVNDYTPGFCGIRSIPTFMLQQPEKVLGKITESDTNKVALWIFKTLGLSSD